MSNPAAGPVNPRRAWLHPLVIALQFLTRLPTPDIGLCSERTVARSLLFYPLVGGLMGLVLWAGAALLAGVFPQTFGVQAALLLALWCLLTGGLHLDGLADSADAWVGGLGDRERTLAIMKDPTSGPMALMVVGLLLLVKFAALEQLLRQGSGWWLLVPLLGRSQMLALFLTTPYVRRGGLATPFSTELPRRAAWGVLLAVVLGGLLLAGGGWVQLVAALAGVFLALRWGLCRRLGGTTGDTAGALIELGEAVLLLVAVTL